MSLPQGSPSDSSVIPAEPGGACWYRLQQDGLPGTRLVGNWLPFCQQRCAGSVCKDISWSHWKNYSFNLYEKGRKNTARKTQQVAWVLNNLGLHSFLVGSSERSTGTAERGVLGQILPSEACAHNFQWHPWELLMWIEGTIWFFIFSSSIMIMAC